MSDATRRPRRTHFITDIIDADNASGKFDGRVVTRFPPEPNGYLHIGHAKSICLNFGLARDYDGQCNLRFDDTNPVKEDTAYVEGIQEDVAWLGFEWDGEVRFASDYFEQMYDYAVTLIDKGLAYVDSQSKEDIREQRGDLYQPGRPSPYRDRPIAENRDLFRRMRAGEFPDGAHVLRAKIDMAAPNVLMRDPLLYRIKHAHHHRTGDAWCIYPMYDYAHCLEDAIEGITHSICTLEFESNRELYDWVLDNLPVPYRPEQTEFARLALGYTVMSKRKLLQLVEEGVVSGWDDPRMPTLAGMRRSGVTPEAIRQFCDMIGVAKNNSLVDIGKLEYCIRDDLNHRAPRVMAVLRPLEVVITNYPEGEVETLDADHWPHDVPREGSRPLPFSRTLYVERSDFAEDPPPKWHRLAPGREVRLRYAYFIRCDEVERDASGEVVRLLCTYDPATRGGHAPDGRKVRGTLHWVSAAHSVQAEVRLYDRLFEVENPGSDASRDFKEDLNPSSLEVIGDARVEPSLVGTAAGERVQFERKGYFFTDPKDSRPDALVFNRIIGLRDGWAKLRAAKAPKVEAAPAAAVKAAPASGDQAKRPSRRTRAHEREDARAADPALAARLSSFQSEHGLAADEADVLTGDLALATFFEAALTAPAAAKSVAKWVLNVVLAAVDDDGSVADLPFTGEALGALVSLVDRGTISTTAGKEVLAHMVATGASDPAAVVADKGLAQVSDESALEAAIDAVMAANPAETERYAGGDKRLFGFFMGKLMREMKGKANPGLARELLDKRLSR